MSARRHLIFLAAGATTWLIVVMFRLRSVDERWWIARDDAVISLSHAKNAARFGTIGVSPGDRVEGFSSPLHVAAAYVLQLPRDLGYRTLVIVLLVVAVAAAGAVTTAALRSTAARVGWGETSADVVAIGSSLAIVVTIAAAWTTVGWLGSGMENPLIVLCGVSVAAAVLLLPGRRSGQVFLVVALSLFSVARVEFAAFTIPLIVATAWLHASRVPIERRRSALDWTIAAPLVFIGAVHVGRRLYFGEWLPNTAVVQSRESGGDQLAFIVVLTALLLAGILRSAILDARRESSLRSLVDAGLSALIAVAAGGLVWMMVTGRTEGSVIDLALMPALLPLSIVVVVLLFWNRAIDARPWLVNGVFAALVSVPLAQYVVLGPARLDQYRVTGTVVPFLAMWAAVLAIRLHPALGATTWPRPTWRRRAQLFTWGVIGSIAIVSVGWIAYKDQPRRLNFEITGAPEIIAVAHATRDQHLAGSGLPILANPDLGKVSFDKSALITDLGLLGDPILTLFDSERPDLVDDYLADAVRPDVVESHSGWSCQYAAWLDTPDFEVNYRLSDDRWAAGRTQAAGCPEDGRWSIWIRTDADHEYELTRRLLADSSQADSSQAGSSPADTVREQIDRCAAAPGTWLRCQGVRRAVHRSSQSLRDNGEWGSVVDVMRDSPSAAFDLPYLERGPGWADEAFGAFVEFTDGDG